MSCFKSQKLTKHITVISGITDEKMFVIQGKKRACLVDTGLGYGNLHEFVEGITRLPVTVLLTHGHLDHTGGACEFEEVYISRQDENLLRTHYTKQAAYDYACSIIPENVKKNISIELFNEQYNIIPQYYAPGQRFDLGGVTLEVLECAGHTPGSVAVLVCEDRKLIIGDACNRGTYLFSDEALSISQYRKNLQSLKKREQLWDTLLFSHYEVENRKEILDEVIGVCDLILQGKADGIPFSFMGTKGYIAMKVNNLRNLERVDGKVGNIIYKK